MTPEISKSRELIVEAEITEADVIAFRRYHLVHSTFARKKVLAASLRILAVWCIVMVIMLYGSSHLLDDALAIWPVLCFPVLFAVVYFALIKRGLRLAAKSGLREGKNRAMLGKTKITLSDDGVTDTGEFSNQFVRWSAVEKVVVTDSAVYIYITTMSAIVAPRRHFNGEADVQQFIACARERLAECETGQLGSSVP